MALCLMCVSIIGDPNMRYHISNMGSELTSAIELQIGYKIQDGEVCEDCFNNILANTTLTSNRDRPIIQDDNLCIWCRSALSNRRSHDIPESPQRIIISEQIAPQVITEGALVCYSCWVRAGRIAREQNIEVVQPFKSNVNTNICVLCYKSLSTRRTHSLPPGPERNYVAAAIHPREIQPAGRLCWNCWQTARRKTINQDLNINEVVPADALLCRKSGLTANENCILCKQSCLRKRYRIIKKEIDKLVIKEYQKRAYPHPVNEDSKVCQTCRMRVHRALYKPTPKSKGNTEECDIGEDDVEEAKTTQNTFIKLSDFIRAPEISNKCFVETCNIEEVENAPLFMRMSLLKQCNFFIPKNCLVCSKHKTDWDFMAQPMEEIHFFKPEHVAGMLQLMTAKC